VRIKLIKPNFAKGNGLIPVIAQDAETKEVLMLAYMNQQAWEETLKTGKATYWSRSRNSLWLKGETSGHVQLVRDIFIDCDDDTILLLVSQLGGAACHTGYKSCFYRKIKDGSCVVVGQKIFDPKEVYK
jgi:phosphoribosyl-AMP cyclohydrolase